jgi:hypothetical protein
LGLFPLKAADFFHWLHEINRKLITFLFLVDLLSPPRNR